MANVIDLGTPRVVEPSDPDNFALRQVALLSQSASLADQVECLLLYGGSRALVVSWIAGWERYQLVEHR